LTIPTVTQSYLYVAFGLPFRRQLTGRLTTVAAAPASRDEINPYFIAGHAENLIAIQAEPDLFVFAITVMRHIAPPIFI
jgi:hypothetical protein